MLESFFPRPRLFFLSAIVWIGLAAVLWYEAARPLGTRLGFVQGPPAMSVTMFWQGSFLWFCLYYAVVTLAFALLWLALAPQRWQGWSVLGSSLILFLTYIQVEVSVCINRWYGPFYDLI